MIRCHNWCRLTQSSKRFNYNMTKITKAIIKAIIKAQNKTMKIHAVQFGFPSLSVDVLFCGVQWLLMCCCLLFAVSVQCHFRHTYL